MTTANKHFVRSDAIEESAPTLASVTPFPRASDAGVDYSQAAAEPASGPAATMADIERQALLDALQRTGGNRTHAARLLGISLSTLKRRLREYGQDPDGH